MVLEPISLQERQADMLRDRIRSLEQRMMEMIRHGAEQVDQPQAASLDRVLDAHAGSRGTAGHHGRAAAAAVPHSPGGCPGLERRPGLPIFCDFAQGVTDDIKLFAESLPQPYCGLNLGVRSSSGCQA